MTGRKIAMIAAGTLALAACAHTTPEIQYRDRIVEVKTPVPVQPIKPADVPIPPAPLGPAPATLQQRADELLGHWCEAVSYMMKANPLLLLSAGEKQADLPVYKECEKP